MRLNINLGAEYCNIFGMKSNIKEWNYIWFGFDLEPKSEFLDMVKNNNNVKIMQG